LVVYLLYVAFCGFGVYAICRYLEDRIKPIVEQLRLCREAMQACRSELAEANLRNRERDRAAYKEKWGVYRDHHIIHPLQPTDER
jgi:hypothetical protein